MDLRFDNPLNINGAHSYILLYEIFGAGTEKRLRIVAACRLYVASPVSLRLEILTDIPQTVFLQQAHDYMQTFKADTVFYTTLPEAARFFIEKRFASATEYLFDAITVNTPAGYYVDYAFSI